MIKMHTNFPCKPTKIRKRSRYSVYYEYHVKGRILVIMRPTQFGIHQLPEPDAPKFIGNFWIIEEYTSKKRWHSGQGVDTVWYKDFETAYKVLKRIIDKNLDVPTKNKTKALKGLNNYEFSFLGEFMECANCHKDKPKETFNYSKVWCDDCDKIFREFIRKFDKIFLKYKKVW